jgi:UDP-N-acetylmuramoylalanine--D-glutamate ligase
MFEPKKLKGARAVVLGLGKSGLQAANLLARKGFRVLVSDVGSKSKLAAAAKELDPRVETEFGEHTGRVLDADFVVKSPGMPPDLPVLGRIAKAKLPVFSEVEIGLAFCPSKRVWAISGTNGKTTTTTLVGAILKAAGRKVHVCGNIGVPVSQAAPKAAAGDEIVLEVSSYQLEDSAHFHPKAAALLNITPDHLDHHRSMNGYMAAKARLFSEQTEHDVAVVNGEDERALKASSKAGARRLTFGFGPKFDATIQDGTVFVKLGGHSHALRPPNLLGRHNLENAAAAALMAASQGVPYAAIQKAFDAFKGVEHRLERSGTKNGVMCVNDSKATNVDSTRVALDAFDGEGRRLLLIMGGRDKGSPYTPLAPLIRQTTKAIFTIGEAAPKVAKDLGKAAPIRKCGTLEHAIQLALKEGHPGDILLLSPACASFDQFDNFEHRGREFKKIVKRMGAK